MIYKKKNKSILYFSPYSNNNYSHNKFLFFTIPKFIRNEIYLLAPENFSGKNSTHYFFQLKKQINSNPLNNNIITKIFKTVRIVRVSIYNIIILYKIIKKITSKEIVVLMDGVKPFDIFFLSLISKKRFKIRILHENFSFNFFLNFIQNFSYYLIGKLNNNFKIIEANSFLKKKSSFINGVVTNQPLHSLFKSLTIKNIGNNIFLPGSYRPEKGFNNVKKILNYQKMNDYNFFLNTNSKNEIIHRKNFFFFKDNLPYKDYLRLLKKSNFVLFPYTHKMYQTSVSGIFTDCILMNKIPIIHKDMLLGKLLEKNKLKILLYNFYDYKNFYSRIKLIKNKIIEINKKIKKFKKNYLNCFTNPTEFWEEAFN
jgi:hypothetical protein